MKKIFIIERNDDYFDIKEYDSKEEAIEYINSEHRCDIEIIIEGVSLDLIKKEIVTKYEFK